MGHEDVPYLPGTSLASGCGMGVGPTLTLTVSFPCAAAHVCIDFDLTLRALILPCTPSSLRLGQMGIEA